MKIDLQSPMNISRGKSGDVLYFRDSSMSTDMRKTDVIDITRGQTSMEEKNFLSLKVGLQRNISYPADPERLESLTEQIRQGTYRVPTEAIVGAMLSLADD